MDPQGQRLAWDDVAPHVRAAIAEIAGAEVVTAASQPGGFSPGVAARCVLADGRRCFVKAVSVHQNPDSPAFHRREGEVAAALPPGLPVPRLLGRFDDGEWVALVFEDVDGAHPSLPWTTDDLAATIAALRALADASAPVGLLPIGEQLGPAFSGFRTLAGGHEVLDRIDPWCRDHLDRLAELEAGWPDAAAGVSLLHCDLRADNLLVRPDGTVVVVDWPHAAVGAAWVDLLFMLPSVGLEGGPGPQQVVDALDPFAGVDDDALDAVLTALTGFFVFGGSLPDPPGLPTVRAFQRAQGEVARAWLAERLGLT